MVDQAAHSVGYGDIRNEAIHDLASERQARKALGSEEGRRQAFSIDRGEGEHLKNLLRGAGFVTSIP